MKAQQIGIAPTIAVADADYTVLAQDTGQVYLVANVSADRTFTLPSVEDGLEYEFVATVVAADGHAWIIDTGSDTNYFLGGLLFADTDAGSSGTEVALAAGDGDSNSVLTINIPAPGTRVKVTCDGTNWVLSGVVVSATAPSFANQ